MMAYTAAFWSLDDEVLDGRELSPLRTLTTNQPPDFELISSRRDPVHGTFDLLTASGDQGDNG